MGNTGFRLAMRLVGPALLVWILWRFGDVDTLIDTFGAASPLPVIAAILLNVVAIHAKLWRWHDLLRQLGAPVTQHEAYRAFLPSLYFGLVTPGPVGDALRIQYLKRDHAVPYAEGLAAGFSTT